MRLHVSLESGKIMHPSMAGDAGAPYNPNIKHKLLIVTLIITILFDMYVAMMLCTLRTGQHIST